MRRLKKISIFLVIIIIGVSVFRFAKAKYDFYKLDHSYSTDTTNLEQMRKVSDVVDIEKKRRSYKNSRPDKDFVLESLNETPEEAAEYEEWVKEAEEADEERYAAIEIPADGIVSTYCPEITMYPLDGRDVSLGYIKEADLYPGVNGSPSVTEQIGHMTYKAYELDEFRGNIAIDLSSVLKDNDLTAEDITVYGSSSSQWADVFGIYELEADWDGNTVCLKTPMQNKRIINSRPALKKDEEVMYIYVSDREKLEVSAQTSDNIAKLLLSQDDINYRQEIKKINTHAMDALSIPVEHEPFGFLTSCPVTAFFLHTDINIYLVDTGNDQVNQLVIDTLKKYYADSKAVNPHYLEIGSRNDDQERFMRYNYNIHYMTELECKAKYATLKPLSLTESFNAHEVQSSHWFFTYMDFDHLSDIEIGKIARKTQYLDEARFDFDTETFVFQNFRNENAEGHCGGMALEVAYCHNINGPIPDYHTEAGIILPEGTISYKITTDRNQTLLDRYLSDYQSSGYTSSKELSYGKDADTDEFLAMMDLMLEMVNKIDIDKERYSLITHTAAVPYLKNGNGSRQLYKYKEIVEPLKKEIDNNRVAIAAFSDKSISYGHVVNIYDYEELIDNNGTVYTRFYIYDNNYPGDNSLYVEMYPVSTVGSEDGLRYTFTTPGYTFTSDRNNNEYKLTLMFVWENDMNIIRNLTPEHNEYYVEGEDKYILTAADVTTIAEKY